VRPGARDRYQSATKQQKEESRRPVNDLERVKPWLAAHWAA
jgi:hypothetical protein